MLGASLPGAPPPPSERFSALGCSADASRFLGVVAAPDAGTGNVVAWDVATGKATPQPEPEPEPVPFPGGGKPAVPAAAQEAAADRGKEGYATGTKTSTTAALSPAPLGVDIVGCKLSQ